MEFSNIEQIKVRFNISSNNPNDIKKQLMQIRKDNHPDRTKGSFSDNVSEQLFLDSSNGIGFLEKLDKTIHNDSNIMQFSDEQGKESKALISINEMKEIIKLVQSSTPKEQTNNSRDNFENKSNAFISKVRYKSRVPKITTSTIFVVMSFIYAFPATASKNPLIKSYVEAKNNYVLFGWIYSIYITATTWIRLKMNEAKCEEILKKLKNEVIQDRMFNYFYLVSIEHGKARFTKNNFYEIVYSKLPYILSRDYDKYNIVELYKHDLRYKMNYRDRKLFNYYKKIIITLLGIPYSSSLYELIDSEVFEAVIDIIFEKALAKEIITKVKSKSLTDEYEILCN